MITLYHHGSSVCAAKVRLVLYEKAIPWHGIYLDILKGDQYSAEFMKINPKHVVPVIEEDGEIIVESTVISEYLDDRYPEPPLRPADPVQRARIRLWTKRVDEEIHPSFGMLTFIACHRHIVTRHGVEEYLAGENNLKMRDRKRGFIEQGFDHPDIRATVLMCDQILSDMEAALADNGWLVGSGYSLADLSLTPYVNRLAMLGMAQMWENGRKPGVERWFEQMKSRPSFGPAMIDWVPDDLAHDLLHYGSQGWPKVKAILGI